MTPEPDHQKAIAKIKEHFGDRSAMQFQMLMHLAMTEQPCDICTRSGQRHLDVKIDPKFIYALMYGAGAKKMAEMLSRIGLISKDGGDSTVSFSDIWIIAPMPKEGFTDAQLAAVDLKEGEVKSGPNGETVREMIRATYRPKDEKEMEYFLRRFIAS